MKTITNKLLFIIVCALFMFVGASCNTMHGFGQDMEEAGDGIQDAAE